MKGLNQHSMGTTNLDHLSYDEKDELAEQFYQTSSPTRLLRERNIDIPPDKLYRYLKHPIETEHCPECGQTLEKRFAARTGKSHAQYVIQCTACKHIVEDTRDYPILCPCKHCRTKRKEEENQRKSQIDQIARSAPIQSLYDLDFDDLLALGQLTYICPNHYMIDYFSSAKYRSGIIIPESDCFEITSELLKTIDHPAIDQLVNRFCCYGGFKRTPFYQHLQSKNLLSPAASDSSNIENFYINLKESPQKICYALQHLTAQNPDQINLIYDYWQTLCVQLLTWLYLMYMDDMPDDQIPDMRDIFGLLLSKRSLHEIEDALYEAVESLKETFPAASIRSELTQLMCKQLKTRQPLPKTPDIFTDCYGRYMNDAAYILEVVCPIPHWASIPVTPEAVQAAAEQKQTLKTNEIDIFQLIQTLD